MKAGLRTFDATVAAEGIRNESPTASLTGSADEPPPDEPPPPHALKSAQAATHAVALGALRATMRTTEH